MIYGDLLYDMVLLFVSEGVEWIYFVDFDGVKEGKRVNDCYVIEIL